MKKILFIVLALAMLLSLCACGNGTSSKNDEVTTEESSSLSATENNTSEEDTLLNIGDTAQGNSCNVTVTAVEFVDKIENGFLEHMWSPEKRDTYKDVTAEDGYSIVKVSYHFEYTGKAAGAIPLSFALNYDDGYIFKGIDGHALPAVSSGTKIGFEEKYVLGGQTRFEIDDPLEFQATGAVTYIFVNDAVKENTDKSYVLEVSIPLSAYNDIMYIDAGGQLQQSAETPESEVFVYNLR